MRRADRLFQIIQLLRRRHVLTAAAIASDLEVSERTVYRDIADLVRSGVPIAGEAGVGYTLRRGFDLPPLMFTEEEIAALVLGTRVVSSWADEGLAKAAESALARIEAALTDKIKARLTGSRLFAPSFHVPQQVAAALADLRKVIDERRPTQLDYSDTGGARTNRVVRPLGLFFWSNKWTLTAWCEWRSDFRVFRIDRIVTLTPDGGAFLPEPGKTIEAYLARFDAT